MKPSVYYSNTYKNWIVLVLVLMYKGYRVQRKEPKKIASADEVFGEIVLKIDSKMHTLLG